MDLFVENHRGIKMYPVVFYAEFLFFAVREQFFEAGLEGRFIGRIGYHCVSVIAQFTRTRA